MSDGNPKRESARIQSPADRQVFEAVLTPYRSLGPNGFLILMICTGAICFVAGLVFLAIGAWPVFGFFGLDILLVWYAFRRNYAAAKAYEEVTVSATEIRIRKAGPGKRYQEFRFNPFWVRLNLTRVEDEGVTKISLVARDQTVDLGNFLNPEDRTTFARAFSAALATAKAGGV